MTLSFKKILLNTLIGSSLLLQIYCMFTQASIFPFSDYSMYSKPIPTGQDAMFELFLLKVAENRSDTVSEWKKFPYDYCRGSRLLSPSSLDLLLRKSLAKGYLVSAFHTILEETSFCRAPTRGTLIPVKYQWRYRSGSQPVWELSEKVPLRERK
jgi:hypothetical protein